MNDITVDDQADVCLTPIAPATSRPRLWPAFVVPIAGLSLAVMFQTLLVVVILILEAAQGRNVEDAASQLPERLSTPNLFMLLAGSGQLAFGLVTLIATRQSATPFRERLGLFPAKQSFAIYPVTMLGSIAVLAIGIGFAIALTWVIPADTTVEKLYEDMTPQLAVPFVLFIAVFPGAIEELLFRGYVQRRLLERWQPATAILVSSIMFALVHIQPHHIALAFPLGIWFGVIVWRTGSVYPGMLCHAFVNGGLNAWRMVVKFGDVPEAAQIVVNVGALLLGAVCLMQSINLMIDDDDSSRSVASS